MMLYFWLTRGPRLQLAAEAMASGSSMATFHAYAVAEQHLPLLQLLERFQEVKELPSCNFQVDIAEVAWVAHKPQQYQKGKHLGPATWGLGLG